VTGTLAIDAGQLAVIREALSDAADYRWQLAGACPRDCMSHAQSCEDCARHQDAAGRYEALDGQLAGDESRRYPLAHPGDVTVRGDLL
jgi:hypothetical protein